LEYSLADTHHFNKGDENLEELRIGQVNKNIIHESKENIFFV
jgi:hypothetical protein